MAVLLPISLVLQQRPSIANLTFMRDTWARIFFGITGFNSLIGVLFSSWVSVAGTPEEIAKGGSVATATVQANPDYFATVFERGINVFFYFTILSNVLVGVVCIILMTNPHKRGSVFLIFRLFSLIAIIITGIVYNTVLRQSAHPEGLSLIENNMMHVIAPILATVGWLIFGPRIQFKLARLGWCALIGLVWIVVTFIRGAITNWYPYPFLNVDSLGYSGAIIACTGILLVAVGLGAAIMGLDKKLPGPKPWLEESEEPVAATSA